MGKAKPLSLYPLSFDEALKVLLSVGPEKVGLVKKKPKPKRNLQRK